MVREKELENYKSSMCLLNTRIALRTKRKKEEKKLQEINRSLVMAALFQDEDTCVED